VLGEPKMASDHLIRLYVALQDPEAKVALKIGAAAYASKPILGDANEDHGEKAAGGMKGRAEAEKELDSVAKLSKEKAELLRRAALAHYGLPKVSSKPVQPAPAKSEQTPTTKAAKGAVDRALGEATSERRVDINGNNKNTLPHSHWENVAHKKKSGMSNTKGGKHSGHAVDGGKAHYGTCTHAAPNRQGRTVTRTGTTTSHPVNWWYVDLGSKKVIKEVHVTNTQGEEHKK